MDYLEGTFGITIIEFLQSGLAGKILWYALIPLHYLGNEMGYILLLPVIYWSFNKKLGREIIMLVLISAIFTNVLKGWWKRPRPAHVSDTIIPLQNSAEYGLPSGHTIFGTVLGMNFTMISKKHWQFLLSIIFIFLMGFSRLVHGMHFLQDVVLGWALGLLFFFLFIKLKSGFSNRFKAMKFSKQYSLISIIAIVGFAVFVMINGDYNYKKSLLSPFGGLIGSILGIVTETRFIDFKNIKNIKIKILRLLTGITSLMIMYFLLDFLYYLIVGEIKTTSTLFLYMIRYGILGFWIFAGVPYLFQKFKLT